MLVRRDEVKEGCAALREVGINSLREGFSLFHYLAICERVGKFVFAARSVGRTEIVEIFD